MGALAGKHEIADLGSRGPLDAVVGLGSNLGDRLAMLSFALARCEELGTVLGCSHVYETPPLGPPQPDYLNAAVRLEVHGTPIELLSALLRIEQLAGRERRVRWGPRTLDLDILWIRDCSLDGPELRVPHPELGRRPFALVPLLEVAPEATDPRTGIAYAEVANRLDLASMRRLGLLSVSLLGISSSPG